MAVLRNRRPRRMHPGFTDPLFKKYCILKIESRASGAYFEGSCFIIYFANLLLLKSTVLKCLSGFRSLSVERDLNLDLHHILNLVLLRQGVCNLGG